jgi:PAS domain S-box-containing protein
MDGPTALLSCSLLVAVVLAFLVVGNLICEAVRHDRESWTAPSAVRDGGLGAMSDVPHNDRSSGVVIDVAERKRAEDALRASDVRYRDLFESTRDAITLLEPSSGRFISANFGAVKLFGAKDEGDFLSRRPWEHSPELQPDGRASAEKAHEMIELAVRVGSHLFEWTHKRANGSEFPAEVLLTPVVQWEETLIYANIRDITERKQTEQSLRNAALYARSLLEASIDPMTVISLDGKLLEANEASVKMSGVPREALLGSDFSLYVTDPEKARAGFQEVYAKGFLTDFPATIRHTSGKLTDVLFNTSLYRNVDGEVVGYFAVARDITERKRAEQTRAFDAAVISSIQQASPDGILLVNPRGQCLSYNHRFLEMWAIPPEIAGDKNDAPVLEFVAMQVANPGVFLARVKELYANIGETNRDEVPLKDGRILDRISTPVWLDDGTYLGRVWYFRDITEPKRAELALRRLNRTLRTLSAASAAVVRATTEEELLNDMCRVGVEVGGYRLAWIGFVERDEAKTVQPVAWAGEHPEFIQTANITWAETERGLGPTGTAIRTGEAQINQNVETNPVMVPWRAEMLRHGFKASTALPLKKNSEVFGALTFYGAEQDVFGSEEVHLLKQLAADLSFGICSRRDRLGRAAALSAQQENLKSTVEAIATSVEMRDAYTAGHQRRVAELAAAIAREIGLTEWQIEGLFLAATIHDVGKINIPAELLSKPGKLSPLEFQMIQTHAQTGYDIIKGINFPWPIGQMVLQHHERLDGSGYPNHLKGEAILIEAKVLAVADVVDAMLAHRPYRPALGLDAALEEIEAGRGRLYDPAAADACIALFRQKDFEFH